MESIIVTSSILTLSISFLLRSLDVIRFRANGVDTFGVLNYCRWLKTKTTNFYVGENPSYPNFVPRLIIFLEKYVPLNAILLIPKILDVATSAIVFLFANWLTGSEFTAFSALIIYTFTPITIINGYGVGTRNVGAFFFTVTLLSSYISWYTNLSFYSFPIAVLSCFLMMNTNRIAYKTFFILTLFLLPMTFLPTIAALLLCLVFSRKEFVSDMRNQWFLIKFKRKRKTKHELLKRAIFVFYYSIWWIAGSLVAINKIDAFLSIWLVVVVILSFVWVWGEGERHIALSAVPASILSAIWFSNRPEFIIPLLLLEIGIICRFSIKYLQGKSVVSVNDDMLYVFSEMRKKISKDALILCLPLAYSAVVAYYVDKKVLDGSGASNEGVEFQVKIMDSVSTQEGLETLVRMYNVSHLFVDTKFFKSFREVVKESCWKAVIHHDKFEVLERI